jgi:hypothetical protein
MSPLRRLVLCAIVPTVLAGCVTPVARAALLPGCGGPADSALNQYCESTPTAQGPQRPTPGGRTVGQAATPALLAAVHRAIPNPAALRRQGRRLRPIVSLPAPVRGAAAGPGAATGSGGTGLTVRDLVLVILGITVLGGLAGLVARRGRTTGPTHSPV